MPAAVAAGGGGGGAGHRSRTRQKSDSASADRLARRFRDHLGGFTVRDGAALVVEAHGQPAHRLVAARHLPMEAGYAPLLRGHDETLDQGAAETATLKAVDH